MKHMTLRAICAACDGTYYGPTDNLSKEAAGITIDSRKVENNWLFGATVGERVDGHSFIESCYEKGALCCLGEKPPVSESHSYIQVQSTFQALKDIAEYYRSTLEIPIVGITGSVGKTSTKEIIASVLSVKFNTLKTAGNFNNEVGLPLTVFNIRGEHEAAVLEMGISDFGEMHRLSKIARPNICVMTNIGQCHLENLGDRDGVLRAKSEIFDFAAEGAKAIVNGDDDKLRTLKSREDLDCTTFGMEKTNDVYARTVENLGLDGLKCNISTPAGDFSAHIHIPGMHMVYNALAGTCVGLACGLTLKEIKTGIEKAETISGRNHLIHTENYTIMDDCYNANPMSMKASLDVLATALGRKVAILGDMGELGANERALHYTVGEHAAKKNIDLLLCVGTLSEEIAKGAKAKNPSMNACVFTTKEELLEKLPELLLKGDSILIKASHFMQFEKIVKALQ
ncbi:MAG: UDP-N-acetylmuramoyl-tripeptide--D-alanyl-D-alanine ligase [Lachnospiraceae bacterium]|nr:UDP-N-acetylmuramoyl-tripeptide--D-alanyl-D-alanine ligase [Lachnospiraceae bacterium]